MRGLVDTCGDDWSHRVHSSEAGGDEKNYTDVRSGKHLSTKRVKRTINNFGKHIRNGF